MPTIAGLSRRTIMLLALIALVFTGLYLVMVQAPRSAASHIESTLHSAGFPDATVGDITLRPSGFVAKEVHLDREGYDRIGELSADLSWPAFLTTGKIGQMSVRDVNIIRTSEALAASGRQLIDALMHLPSYRLTLSNVVVDLGTQYGDLRLTAEAAINSDSNSEDRDIKARILAAQYQLGFESNWEGALRKDGRLELAAKLEGGRLNFGPLQISRFNGWMGLDVAGTDYSFQSQMEAGGAKFFDIPLHNVTLVNDHRAKNSSIIARAGISGMKDVLFTADYTRDGETPTFVAALKGSSLGGLLDYVEESTGHAKTLRPALEQAGRFNGALTYQPERGFVGGPLPFAASMTADGKNMLNGTLLFYPENFDVRGSLETEDDMIGALKDYFKIPSTSIRQNFIRLDGNSRKLLRFEEEKKN